MKKALLPITLVTLFSVLIYSCSSGDDDSAPPSVIQTTTPEPETPPPTQYTLTVSAGDGGSVSSEGGTYDEGTKVTVTANPNDGYKFLGWSDGDSSPTRNVTISSEISIKANFFNVFYQFESIPIYDEDKYFASSSLVADLDNDGNEELILTIINNENHSNSNLIKKTPIKVLGFEETRLIDVTSKFFDQTPETFCTRQIFFEDLNHDGLKDLYFANHGAEVNDISVLYHQETGVRTDGIWAEQDLVYFNSNGIFQKAEYFNAIDYSHGVGIINLKRNGENAILRNEPSPPPLNLGGKNSIIKFENNQFVIDSVLASIEDNLWQEYFCSGSLWVYPIDIDGDGIDEVVTQNKIFKIQDNSFSSVNLMEGQYASQNFFLNEGGFVIDIDNDGDEDLVKSASLTSQNCSLVNYVDNQIEFYENQSGELRSDTNKLPPHPTNLSKFLTPFDINFDGLMDIVFYSHSPEEPNIFFMNNGNGFDLREINLDQFDGYVLLNGEQTRIQQFPSLKYSWFLKSNDGYNFVTGIDNGIIGFKITESSVSEFIKQ